MAFSKSFPRTSKTSPYPQWEEIFLTDEEEKEQEEKCRNENIKLMKECTEDAKALIQEKGLDQADLTNVAISLFEKRASHSVYWKESKAKEKFDEKG